MRKRWIPPKEKIGNLIAKYGYKKALSLSKDKIETSTKDTCASFEWKFINKELKKMKP